MIHWLGKEHTEHWPDAPPSPEAPAFTMALAEASVLDCAYGDYPGRRLSQSAAICCVSRYAQRKALGFKSRLNPRWHSAPWEEGFLKAPASCQNEGIYHLQGNPYLDLLRAVSASHAQTGVWEEEIPGPQWELDGFILGGEVHFFLPLLQTWEDQGGPIVSAYERCNDHPPKLHEAVTQAVHAVGLDDSCFCAEMRHHKDQWKVVELHARLGEDKGLPGVMWDSNPLEYVAEVAGNA